MPSCLVSQVNFRNGSCQFFFRLSRSISKVKGHGFRTYKTDNYVMILGGYTVNRRTKPGNIEIRYLRAVCDEMFK